MKPPLLGQTAIVTGGARGIGLAIAQRLTELGCRAVIWDVDVSSLGGSGSFQPHWHNVST
jgi:NAD(P)-dependent dehydrogenase (short-subunit alcohol dehydrogenase family)